MSNAKIQLLDKNSLNPVAKYVKLTGFCVSKRVWPNTKRLLGHSNCHSFWMPMEMDLGVSVLLSKDKQWQCCSKEIPLLTIGEDESSRVEMLWIKSILHPMRSNFQLILFPNRYNFWHCCCGCAKLMHLNINTVGCSAFASIGVVFVVGLLNLVVCL